MEEVESQALETHGSHLVVPPPETLRLIAEKQDAKAAEIATRRREERERKEQKQHEKQGSPSLERNAAAELIQKNYRGYRTRRQLRGYGLDPSSRWVQLMKEAKYHNNTAPMSQQERESMSPDVSAKVRDRWKRVGAVANRAGSDDESSSSDIVDVSDPEEMEKLRKRKERQRNEMKRNARAMGESEGYTVSVNCLLT